MISRFYIYFGLVFLISSKLELRNISSMISKPQLADNTFEEIQSKLNSQLRRQISKEKILRLNLEEERKGKKGLDNVKVQVMPDFCLPRNDSLTFALNWIKALFSESKSDQIMSAASSKWC